MKDYKDNSNNYIDAVRDKFFGNLENAGKTYQELLKWYLDEPPKRSGHVYKNIEGKAEHTAAAPDPKKGGAVEPPAPLSRELINSIEFEQGPQSDFVSEVYILSNLEYVLALEFGSPSRNLQARPAWNIVLTTFRDEIGDIALEGFYRR